MASKRTANKNQRKEAPLSSKVKLRTGDKVMVVAGGNKHKRANKGEVGRLQAFVGKKGERVIVEGINMITKHQRQLGPDKPAGIVKSEGSIHVSNVMYYAEKIKRPVRLKSQVLEDGTKVRGYTDPESKEFVQI